VVRAPPHAPLAVHDVALVLDQVSVAALPATTEVGVADSETVGAVAADGVGGGVSALSPLLLQATDRNAKPHGIVRHRAALAVERES
jgi:hypothetical protein